MFRNHVAFPAVTALSIASMASPVSADTILVPGDVATIQGAINLASDADEIVVSPGIYNEAINFLGVNAIVRSTDGADTTIIDASGIPASVVTFETNENFSARLEGFTLTGGTGRIFGSSTIGGGLYISGAEPTIMSCRITGNSADAGGGVYVTNSLFLMQLANSAIFDNVAAQGAGLYASFSNPVVRNCTIADNRISDSFTQLAGAGIFATSSTVRIANTIVWGNVPDSLAGDAPIATYSDIEGGVAGPTNLDVNPQFEDLAGGDLRLGPSSPCVDSADSTIVADDVFKDLAGGQRGVNDPLAFDTGIAVFGLVVDMGAMERQEGAIGTTCIADINGDELVGFDDLLELLARWGPCP